MTVDDPGDGDNANSAAEGHRFPDTDTDTDTDTTEADTAEARAGEPATAEAATEDRDREECYHDLRTRDPAARRTADVGIPGESGRPDDGQWHWKGLELGRPANRVADEQLAARREAEGRDEEGGYGVRGITPAMRRIEAELEHGTLAPDTEKFALKSPDRFKEKLAKMIKRYPDQAASDIASTIHDGIRYTFLFPNENYTAGVAEVAKRLSDDGYDLRLRKPSWDAEDYRGVNTRWCDVESGVLFEVQFHTPESWEAKQRTHDIYEKLCDTRITPAEREQLDEQQRLIVTAIPVPPGAENIDLYVKGQSSDHE